MELPSTPLSRPAGDGYHYHQHPGRSPRDSESSGGTSSSVWSLQNFSSDQASESTRAAYGNNQSSDYSYDAVVRIGLFGDPGSRKTILAQRFAYEAQGSISSSSLPVLSDRYEKTFSTDENNSKRIRVVLCDYACPSYSEEDRAAAVHYCLKRERAKLNGVALFVNELEGPDLAGRSLGNWCRLVHAYEELAVLPLMVVATTEEEQENHGDAPAELVTPEWMRPYVTQHTWCFRMSLSGDHAEVRAPLKNFAIACCVSSRVVKHMDAPVVAQRRGMGENSEDRLVAPGSQHYGASSRRLILRRDAGGNGAEEEYELDEVCCDKRTGLCIW